MTRLGVFAHDIFHDENTPDCHGQAGRRPDPLASRPVAVAAKDQLTPTQVSTVPIVAATSVTAPPVVAVSAPGFGAYRGRIIRRRGPFGSPDGLG